jgi:hypothetical protein
MRIGIVLFLVAAAIIANIYTDGRLVKSLNRYKKYYQMAAVGFVALAIYLMFKKSPDRAREMVMTSHEYLKYLPVDKNASSILNPILDFTSKYGSIGAAASHPILNLGQDGRQDGRQDNGPGWRHGHVHDSCVAHRAEPDRRLQRRPLRRHPRRDDLRRGIAPEHSGSGPDEPL